jgi:hypothetical protein
LDKECLAFSHLKEQFCKLNEEKLKEGIFVGPKIRKLLKDRAPDTKLSQREFLASSSIMAVVNGFLGEQKRGQLYFRCE